MEILITIIVTVAVIALGINLYARYQMARIEKRVDEINKILMKEMVIEMEIDYHNEEYFAYDFNDKSFLCKGKDYQELAKAFESRFPEKRGAIKRYLNCTTIIGMPNHLKMNPDES